MNNETEEETVKFKKIFLIFLTIVLLCSCAPSEPNGEKESESSSESEVRQESSTPEMLEFFDLAGNKARADKNAELPIEFEFAYGWTLSGEGYEEIAPGTELFCGKVSNALSRYTEDYNGELICSYSEYSVSDCPQQGIRGMFIYEEKSAFLEEEPEMAIYFYPCYDSEGKGFYILESRSEISEKLLREKGNKAFSDGSEAVLQPIPIYFAIPEEISDMAKELEYVPAIVHFDSFEICGFSQAWEEPVTSTRIYGSVTDIELIID